MSNDVVLLEYRWISGHYITAIRSDAMDMCYAQKDDKTEYSREMSFGYKCSYCVRFDHC